MAKYRKVEESKRLRIDAKLLGEVTRKCEEQRAELKKTESLKRKATKQLQVRENKRLALEAESEEDELIRAHESAMIQYRNSQRKTVKISEGKWVVTIEKGQVATASRSTANRNFKETQIIEMTDPDVVKFLLLQSGEMPPLDNATFKKVIDKVFAEGKVTDHYMRIIRQAIGEC